MFSSENNHKTMSSGSSGGSKYGSYFVDLTGNDVKIAEDAMDVMKGSHVEYGRLVHIK